MSISNKVEFCKSLINDVSISDEQVKTYLDLAQERILERLYPFGDNANGLIPARYDATQCELAVRMIARRGGEGEISHSENGIARSYASVNDEDILSRITPYVGVMVNVKSCT